MANDVIQVNYETLERIQREFARRAEEAAQLHQRLKNGADRLVGSKWEGEAARQFFSEMDDEVLPAFDRLAKALTGCQDVTAELIQEFRRAEEEAAGLFRKDGDAGSPGTNGGGTSGTGAAGDGGSPRSGIGSGVAGGGGGGGGGGAWGEVSQEDYDWYKWSSTTYAKSVSTLKGALVQMMGAAGKNAFVQGFSDSFSVGFGFMTDEDFQKDNLRAVAGEVGKVLLKKGLSRLIPGAGTVLLVSDGLQVVAWLGAGVVAAAGNAGLAKQITESAKYIDLGGWLEEGAEQVFDGARQGVNMAGDWISNASEDLLGSLQLSPVGSLAN